MIISSLLATTAASVIVCDIKTEYSGRFTCTWPLRVARQSAMSAKGLGIDAPLIPRPALASVYSYKLHKSLRLAGFSGYKQIGKGGADS